MWLNRTSAPSTSPVTLAEAKAHLRVLHTHDDAYITALIAAATEHLDGRRGYLGRALITQSWELRVHAFPACGVIQIPLPPLQSVASVTYIDDAGAEQTLAADQYVVDTGTMFGQVRRAYDVVWPVTRYEEHAVRIEFTAGYGDAADVPMPIKQAMLLQIGHLYANRQEVTDAEPFQMPQAGIWLTSPYRVPAF